MLPKLIVILGPTSSGKTSLSLRLAKIFKGYIISADSRQVYKKLDLGTGKVYAEDDYNYYFKNEILYVENIPHFMIDILEPDKQFNAAKYQKMVFKILKQQAKKNKKSLPFLVGGAGLYIRAVTDNLLFTQAKPNLKLRQKLSELPIKKLLDKLKKLDPKTAVKIDVHNKIRLIRALEICLQTQKPYSKQRRKGPKLFDILKIGIQHTRKKLYQNIDKRVDQRIKLGMIKEVEDLLNKNLSRERLYSLGLEYRLISLYLKGKIKTQDEMISQLKYATHHFARRQITWFKKDKTIKWVKNEQEAVTIIKSFLKS